MKWAVMRRPARTYSSPSLRNSYAIEFKSSDFCFSSRQCHCYCWWWCCCAAGAGVILLVLSVSPLDVWYQVLTAWIASRCPICIRTDRSFLRMLYYALRSPLCALTWPGPQASGCRFGESTGEDGRRRYDTYQPSIYTAAAAALIFEIVIGGSLFSFTYYFQVNSVPWAIKSGLWGPRPPSSEYQTYMPVECATNLYHGWRWCAYPYVPCCMFP